MPICVTHTGVAVGIVAVTLDIRVAVFSIMVIIARQVSLNHAYRSIFVIEFSPFNTYVMILIVIIFSAMCFAIIM